ncbi:MAG: Rid family detoxifying hydrolase, partial [Cyanobacteriota bacterium]
GADLSLANLSSAKLQYANLRAAKLRQVDLQNVDLSDMNLANLDLRGANLKEANLKKANLQGANLERISLESANLLRANLEGANLKRANLDNARTYGASFRGADLTGAIMPDGARYKPQTSDEEIDNQEAPQKNSQILIPATRQVIFTDKAPAPLGAYSQAIASSGQLIFVAGQIAIDMRLNDIVYTDNVEKQTEQVITNIGEILIAAGATFQNIVKITVFLADMNDFSGMNKVYAKYFDQVTAPARVCIQVSRLPKNVLVEMDCIAVI